MCEIIRFTDSTTGRINNMVLSINNTPAAVVDRSHEFTIKLFPNDIRSGISMNGINRLFEDFDIFASQFSIGQTDEPYRFNNVVYHVPSHINGGPRAVHIFDGKEIFRIIENAGHQRLFLVNERIDLFLFDEFRRTINQAIVRLNNEHENVS